MHCELVLVDFEKGEWRILIPLAYICASFWLTSRECSVARTFNHFEVPLYPAPLATCLTLKHHYS